MAKNDKIKEQLAESRHNETIRLMAATFGLGILSIAFAYGMLVNSYVMLTALQVLQALLPFIVLLVIWFAIIGIFACSSRRERKGLIKQIR